MKDNSAHLCNIGLGDRAPNEKAVALKIQHGYSYKLSLFRIDYFSTGWSGLLLNKCQMPQCESVVVRGALVLYYQSTEGWLSQMGALPASSKVDEPSLVETKCTYLDKPSLCILVVVLCLYNDLEKKPYSLHVPVLSKSIPRSEAPSSLAVPSEASGLQWCCLSRRAVAQAQITGLQLLRTFKWVLFWADFGFFPLWILSLDVIAKLWSSVLAHLQLWTKILSRQSKPAAFLRIMSIVLNVKVPHTGISIGHIAGVCVSELPWLNVNF